jgi:hypothetical protein
MIDSSGELQRIKGIGAITARRLVDAGIDSTAALVEYGIPELRLIKGINPRSIPDILEQARELVAAEAPPDPIEALRALINELRYALEVVATDAREDFREELAGKAGVKLNRNLVACLDALDAIEEQITEKPEKFGRRLAKIHGRLIEMPGDDLKKIRKGIKRARKSLDRSLS